MTGRVPPFVTDAVLGVGLFALTVSALRDYDAIVITDVYTRESDAFTVLLIALQTLPLIWRRRYPVAVAIVIVGAWLLDRGLDYPNTIAGIGTLVAIHAVGSQLSRRRSMIVGLSIIGVVTAYTAVGVVRYDSVGPESIVFVLLTGLVALYLGREVNQRQREIVDLEQRAANAEREREERARDAVASERARIARELHDVVAHQIVVMTVQAEGASRLATDADPRVREALGTISSAGREGLAEMRRMVGLLREPADGEPMEPQPGVADVERLSQHFADAGLPVVVHVTGRPRRLPGGVDVNAYRIVQESLTNALKHGGPGATADVTLAFGTDILEIMIVDDGRGAIGPSTPGHGIVGMTERAAMLAGELHAGPRVGGGFEVRASIPVAS